MRRLLLLLSSLLLLSLDLWAAGPKIEEARLQSLGKSRHYYFYVPAAAASGPAPLLLLLHGSGRNGRILVESWRKLADKEGIILVGPDASNPQFWNTKNDGPAFLRDVIEDVKAKCSVDAQRLYLFGHSAGASYGLMIAMLESGYFAAAAVHAGALHEEEYRMLGYASRKIPIAVWSGSLDRSIPIDAVEATVAEMKRQQFPAELSVMRGHDHNYYMVSDDVNRAAWDFLRAKKNDNPQFKEWQFE